MIQPELTPVARTSDPDTSWDAAKSVKDLTRKQGDVLWVIRYYGSTTDRDLVANHEAQFSFAQPQSESGIRTRRSELVKLGLVRDSGRRRRLVSGRQAIIWEAV